MAGVRFVRLLLWRVPKTEPEGRETSTLASRIF
jgi:hypothetical protein